MTWPLIERELRAASRKPQLREARKWGTLACAAIAALFLIIGPSSGIADWGKNLNLLLFWAGVIIVLQVPTYTVGLFAEDRRNQTLGLIFLCGISPMELFVSKTLGAALVSLSRLMIVYPFFSISFLGGGLSLDVFVATVTCLPVLMFFAFSVCVLASVLCREESTAMFVAMLFSFLTCATTPVIHIVGGAGANPSPLTDALLVLSPARPAYLAATRLGSGTMGEFWMASAASLLWSALILSVAGILLSRIWQEKPDAVTAGTPRARFRNWFRGDALWRKSISRRWNDTNPYVWLAMRDRWPVTMAWIVVGVVMLLSLAASLAWPDGWICPASFFLTATILNCSLTWISTFAAAKTIGDNRRSGGLELLLTTPLNPLDIVRGQLVALREQFRPVAWSVLVFEIVMLAAGLVAHSWTMGGLAVYLIIWSALMLWTADSMRTFRNDLPVFWDSLVCGRPAYVALRKSGFTVSPAWIGYMIFIGGSGIHSVLGGGLKHFPSGSFPEYFFCGVGLIVLILTGAARRSTARRSKLRKIESRLARDFRTVAAKPVPEPSDSRYKYWRSGERFPEMLADVLVGRIVRHMQEEKARTAPDS